MISWLRHGSARATLLVTCVVLLSCSGKTRRLLWANEAPELTKDAAVPMPHDAGARDTATPLVPMNVMLTERSNSSLHGGKDGDVFADTCPSNQVLVGAHGSLLPEALGAGDPPWIGSIAAICAEISLAGDASTAISTGPTATLQERGTHRSMTWEQLCPSGQIVVGISGRSGEALDEISIICAVWSVSSDRHKLVRASDSAIGLPSAGGSGGNSFEDWCDDAQLSTGFLARADAWVDALGISCATPTLTL